MAQPERNSGEQDGSSFLQHLEALERAADQLERADLDPEQALKVFKVALRHHRAAEAILGGVQDEFNELIGAMGS